jgi:hypothetical protein
LAKQLGNQAFGAKKFREACEHYSRAIDLDPTNPIYFSNRAMCHSRLGDHAKALEDAEKVIQLKPEWAKGYYRKAAALVGLSKYILAEEAFLDGLRYSEEKDAEELQKGLASAQQFARLEKHAAYKGLRARKGGPSDKDLLEIIQNNLSKLQSEEFGKLVTSVTLTVGDTWRCMRPVLVDDEGLILRLAPPSPFVNTDMSVFEQLREGGVAMVNIFVHVGKKGTPNEGKQEFAFDGWHGRGKRTADVSNKSANGGENPLLQKLTSQELNWVQRKVMEITIAEANASVVVPCFNPTINRLLLQSNEK